MRRSLIVQRSLLVLIALSCFSEASRANILDLFYNDISKKAASAFRPHPAIIAQAAANADASVDVTGDAKEAVNANMVSERQAPSATPNQAEEKSCACEKTSCMCCVDFNVTFIDLGGPGCVKMRYLSRDEGILLNVSYGDSLLRSAIATAETPTPTCVPLLTHIAEICARFSSLSPHGGGLKGCLKLEPKLLGDAQTQFSIGCFLMSDAGMRLDEEQQEEETVVSEGDAANANQTNPVSELDGISSDDLLAAVNGSAQKGLALFQNWLGISFVGGNATANEEESQNEAKSKEAPERHEKGTKNQLPSKMMGDSPAEKPAIAGTSFT